MKFIGFVILLLNCIFVVSCGGEDEGTEGSWGLEEPVISSSHGSVKFTHLFKDQFISLNDKIEFNKKYENKNITLNITSICDEHIRNNNFKLKTTIFFKEIIPYQIFLDEQQKEVLNCQFNFEAKNNNGDTHSFKSGKFKFNVKDLNKLVTPFKIKQLSSKNNKELVIKKEVALKLNELVVPELEAKGEYHIVCNNFVKQLKLGELWQQSFDQQLEKYPINKCMVLYVGEYDLKTSLKFALKKDIPKPEVYVKSLSLAQEIKYGSTINGIEVTLQNNTDKPMNIVFQEEGLTANMNIQYPVKRSLRGVFASRYRRSQQMYELEPKLFVKGFQVLQENNFYSFHILPGNQLKIDILYKLGLKSELSKLKRCYTSQSYNIAGYKFIRPNKINWYQVGKVKSSKEEALSIFNVLNQETNSLTDHVVAHKYSSQAHKCTKAYLKDLERNDIAIIRSLRR